MPNSYSRTSSIIAPGKPGDASLVTGTHGFAIPGAAGEVVGVGVGVVAEAAVEAFRSAAQARGYAELKSVS